jgi:hypothetical protein
MSDRLLLEGLLPFYIIRKDFLPEATELIDDAILFMKAVNLCESSACFMFVASCILFWI